MDREPAEREEYEHVPWSELVAEARPDRMRLALLGTAIAVAAAIGLFGARLLFAQPVPPTTDSITATAPTVVAATIQATAETAAPASTAPAPALHSEADLMAVLPDEETRAVAARAEWFVRDFFTVDDAGGAAPSPAPATIELPTGAEGPATYVEWATALRVRSETPKSYSVTVAFRMLAETDSGTFARQPVRAVEVPLQLDESGAPVVNDLPTPVGIEAGVDAEWPTPEPAPEAVVARALLAAAAYGTEPVLLESSRTAGGWRLIIAVTDASGVRWPLRFEIG